MSADSGSTITLPTAACDAHVDAFHRDAGDLGEAGAEIATEEADLRRPAGIGRLDEQRATLQADRSDVGGDRRSNGFVPAAENAADLDAPRPGAQGADDAIEGVGDRQRVVGGAIGSVISASSHWCTLTCCDQLAPVPVHR